MMEFDLHPELREQLLERLAHRADRLAKVAKLGTFSPDVIAMMTEHVAMTAMLLCGDRLAGQLFSRCMQGMRKSAGICYWCGERPASEGKNHPMGAICAVCSAEMIAMDEGGLDG